MRRHREESRRRRGDLLRPAGRLLRYARNDVISSFFVGVVFFGFLSVAFAADSTPRELGEVGIQERLGAQVSLDLPFFNEAGEEVTLGKYLSRGKPVLLAMVYYECPNLCQFLLQGINESLRDFSWDIGDKFEVVNISIDPKETPNLATAKKESHLEAYGRAGAEKGWHFLTDKKGSAKKIADEVGFHYTYDKRQKQYAHAAGVFILSPEGVLTRVLYGIQFDKTDLRLALLEGSKGKVGSVVDKLLLYCYSYDPQTRRYSLMARNAMRVGGVVTVVLLAGFILYWRRRK